MRDLDRRTRRTEVRNSRVMTGFCLTSSQIMSCVLVSAIFRGLVRSSRRDLVLGEFGIFAPADQGEVVGLAEHLSHADACIEVCAGERFDSSPSLRQYYLERP